MRTVLKLGGELLEDTGSMARAAAGLRALLAEGPVAVVHGGGRAIDADLRSRGTAATFVDGQRITDEATLESVVAVLAGRINTRFVAALTAAGVPAVGLTGADGRIALCDPAPALRTSRGSDVHLGLVGVPRAEASPRLVLDLISLGYVPVIATIGVTADGSLLNVNADVLASHLARAIAADRLLVAGSTPGVFDDAGGTCSVLDPGDAHRMVAAGTARDGMVTKLNACLHAIAGGVPLVRIVDGRAGRYATADGTTIAAAPESIQC